MSRWLYAIPLAAIGIAALVLSVTFRELTFHLLFGWAVYLRRVLPEVNVRWDGVSAFLLGLSVFTVLLHWIAAWLRREMSEQTEAWRWRSTTMIVGLVMMMFVAGIALVGVTHQAAWLATEDGKLLAPALPNMLYPHASIHNLKTMAIETHNFMDTYHRMPTRAPIAPDQVEHSWVTQILPVSALRSDLDMRKSWDHPDNQTEIRKLVPFLLNPGLRPLVLRDENGYGVSHYAGNTHLFDHPERLSPSDISDGTANTLMIGEVSASFQPWAKPRANRDPALGVNRSPDGFGGPAANGGAQFAMADGSVKFFSSKVDPAVLKALGTLNGGEPIDEAQLKQ